jgi:hypothetical protein
MKNIKDYINYKKYKSINENNNLYFSKNFGYFEVGTKTGGDCSVTINVINHETGKTKKLDGTAEFVENAIDDAMDNAPEGYIIDDENMFSYADIEYPTIYFYYKGTLIIKLDGLTYKLNNNKGTFENEKISYINKDFIFDNIDNFNFDDLKKSFYKFLSLSGEGVCDDVDVYPNDFNADHVFDTIITPIYSISNRKKKKY